ELIFGGQGNYMEIREIGSGGRKYHPNTRNIGIPVWGYEQEAHLHRPGIYRNRSSIQRNRILARHIVKVVRRQDIDVQQNKGKLHKDELCRQSVLQWLGIFLNDYRHKHPKSPIINYGYPLKERKKVTPLPSASPKTDHTYTHCMAIRAVPRTSLRS